MVIERNCTIIWDSGMNKELVISGLKKRVAALRKEVSILELNKDMDADVKQKKIAKRQEIIKNCQKTIDTQIAYMHQAAESKIR